jgi:neutral ceramidase
MVQEDGTIPSFSQLPALRSPLVWVAGYCNDMFGYLPTRRVQSEGGYEGGRANLWSSIPAPFTEDVEDRVTDAVRRLVDRTSE